MVLASALYAAGMLYARRRLSALDPLVLSVGSLAGGALSLLPLALVAGVPVQPSPAPFASLLALSLLGTAVAYLLYFHLLMSVGATQTALVTYLNPATAVLWGWAVLGEPIMARTLVGLGLILGASSWQAPSRDRRWRAALPLSPCLPPVNGRAGEICGLSGRSPG